MWSLLQGVSVSANGDVMCIIPHCDCRAGPPTSGSTTDECCGGFDRQEETLLAVWSHLCCVCHSPGSLAVLCRLCVLYQPSLVPNERTHDKTKLKITQKNVILNRGRRGRGVAAAPGNVVEPSTTGEWQRVNGLHIFHGPLSSSHRTTTSCVLPTSQATSNPE